MKKKESRNKYSIKLNKKQLLYATCVIILCVVFCIWQNNDLEVTNYTYSSDDITSDFNGYRIVQVSDLHNKNFGTKSNRLIEAIQKFQPDMIVITGDVVDSNHTKLDVAIDFLKQAATIAPCYYITGNHELWLEKEVRSDLMTRITDTGVILLDDEVVEIIPNNNSNENFSKSNSFILVGLDNGSLYGDTLHKLTKDIDENQFVLLLAHEPQNFENYSNENIDLILSGHAHGGQIRLPFIGGLVAPDQGFMPEYTKGFHLRNDVSMIISRGLGNSIIPVRLFNRPEIVCIELQSK